MNDDERPARNKTHEHERLLGELSASETRYRDLIEHASDGTLVADLEGRNLDVNRAACRMLGYERAELLEKSLADLIPPGDAGRLAEVRSALLRGETHVGEWLLRKKDGEWLATEVSAKILADGRWQTFVRDITERKATERALRLSEAKFSGIVSISADAIISMDEAHRITLFNEGAEKVFGYTREEVLGQPLEMLIPERYREGHRRGVARFTAGTATARRMGEMGRPIYGRRKNGEEFPADAAISKLELGGTTIYTATMRDVTEQKRAEDEQRFLSELGALLASSLDYEETLTSIARLTVREFADLCLVDVLDDGGEVRRLRTLSRDPSLEWACEVLTRVPIDRTQPHLIGGAFSTRQSVLMEELTPDEVHIFAQQEERRRALSAIDPRSAIAVPLLARGQLLGVLGFVRSGASRRYGPRELQLAEALAMRAALALDNARLYRAAQRAIQARDEVLGVVAHDLRNPLSAILMQTQLLKRSGYEPLTRANTSMDSIRRSVVRMNRMIQDLLDVTRMEGGRLAIDREPVAPEQVIGDCVESQRPLTSAASLELRCEVSPDVADVWADRDRLLQVLENLVGNALKFTPSGGEITVGAAPSDWGVLFWVTDNGAGIAADELPHVFDRFWQGRGDEHRGAGLGLAIVKGLVEAHGGHIWAESAVARGTTFFFTLPLAPLEPSSLGEASERGR